MWKNGKKIINECLILKERLKIKRNCLLFKVRKIKFKIWFAINNNNNYDLFRLKAIESISLQFAIILLQRIFSFNRLIKRIKKQ